MPVSHIERTTSLEPTVTITVGNDTIAATLAHPFWVVSGECLESRPLARSRDGANRASSENGRWYWRESCGAAIPSCAVGD